MKPCGGDDEVSLTEDIACLKKQEEVLRFSKFDEADAWSLGQAMHAAATSRKQTFVIDIQIAGRTLFYSALPGTAPDHQEWVKRKTNAVMRWHKSSYRLGRELAQSGKSLDESQGVSPIAYASHGGSFPIHIIGTGVVGTITVSGMPQRDDHNFVVECVAKHLNINHASVVLDAE